MPANNTNEAVRQTSDQTANTARNLEVLRQRYETLGNTMTQFSGFATAAVAPLVAFQATALAGAKQTEEGKAALGGFQSTITSLQTALAPFATALLQLGTTVLTPLVGIIQQVGTWFSSLSPILQMVVTGFMTFAAFLPTIITFIGGLLSTFSMLIPVLTVIGTAIGSLGGVMGLLINPVTLVIAGIAALTAAVIYAWNNFEWFRNVVTSVWTAISTGFSALVAYLQPAITAVVSFFLQQFNQIKAWWTETWPLIQQILVNVWNFISPFLQSALSGIVSAMQAAWGFIGPLIQTTMNGIMTVMQYVWPLVESLIVSVWNNIKGVISGAIGVITNIISLFANLFTGNWSAVWDSALNILKSAFTLIWNLVQLWGIGKVLGLFSKLGSSVLGVFRNMGSSIMGAFRNMWSTLTSSASSGLSTITSSIRTAFSGILSWFTNLGSSFFNAGKGLITQISNGIKNAATGVLNTVKDLAGKIRDFLPFSPAKVGPLSDLNHLDFAGPIQSSIAGGMPKVQGAMSHLLRMPTLDTGMASGVQVSSGSGIVNNFNISELVVREEADIELISQQLYKQQKRSLRASGVNA